MKNLNIKHVLKHPLFSGSALMIGGSMAVNVVNYIYHLTMGRILGPVDYGILASLFSILYIISIVPTSTSVSIVKFISSNKNPEEVSVVYRAINRLILFVGIMLAIIMVLISPVLADFLHIDNVGLVILIVPVIFFSLTTLVNQATSQGLLKFMGLVLPNLTSALTKLILGVIFILLGWSVFGAMAGVVAGAMIAYFISLQFVKRIKKANHHKYNLKPFLRYSFPVLLQALAFTSIFTTDIILVKHFLSPFDAGLYAAISMLGKIIYFASSPISAVMFPVISGKYARGERYSKIFWAALVATVAISSIIVLFYGLFSNLAIGILYGNAYLSAQKDLIWMGIFILIYTVSILLVNFSLSLGKTKIVVLPIIAALGQVILIYLNHSSILITIQMSLIACGFMFIGLFLYLGYNFLYKTDAKL